MKKVLLIFTVLFVLSLGLTAGCGEAAAIGAAGFGAGFLGSETLKGFEADLDKREAELIAAYNKGVESGAEKETLDQIEKELQRTRQIKEGTGVVKTVLGVDWSKPKEAAGAIALITQLGVAIFLEEKLRKRNKSHSALKKGVNKTLAESEPEVAAKLYSNVGAERNKLKLG